MAAGTAITPVERPAGHFMHYQFSLDPGAIAAAGVEIETVAIPGVRVGDVVNVCPQAALSAGLIVLWARAVAGGIEFAIGNYSAGAVDQALGVWNATVMRGTTTRIQ